MPDQINGLLSPFLRTIRINAARPHLRGDILDYGCDVGALSIYIENSKYVGVDIDKESIGIATKTYPNYSFHTLGSFRTNKKFDTIVGLALIEHIKDPKSFLIELKSYLNKDGRIVLTTPHPYVDKIHFYGSRIGLFSQNAEDEHESLIDFAKMASLTEASGLEIYLYKRFLLGTNQLFILEQKYA